MDLTQFDLTQFGMAGVFIGYLIWDRIKTQEGKAEWEKRYADAMEKRAQEQKEGASLMANANKTIQKLIETCGKDL